MKMFTSGTGPTFMNSDDSALIEGVERGKVQVTGILNGLNAL
jgi:hypothetical protein